MHEYNWICSVQECKLHFGRHWNTFLAQNEACSSVFMRVIDIAKSLEIKNDVYVVIIKKSLPKKKRKAYPQIFLPSRINYAIPKKATLFYLEEQVIVVYHQIIYCNGFMERWNSIRKAQRSLWFMLKMISYHLSKSWHWTRAVSFLCLICRPPLTGMKTFRI